MNELRQAILGIDVGGTSVKAALFECTKLLKSNAFWSHDEPTQRGVSANTEQIKSVVEAAKRVAALHEIAVVAFGIGSPGRFDSKGHIRPGSASNLELENHDFDGVNLQQNYDAALGDEIPVLVRNDGDAMLAGMLDVIRQSKTAAAITWKQLHGKTVALFGIGTGLGHSIAKVANDGQGYQFVTDGHASKLLIDVDAPDLKIYQMAADKLEADTGKKELFKSADGRVRAEDLCRAPLMAKLCEIDSHEELDFENNMTHQQAYALMGKYLGRIIATIYKGVNDDIEPKNGWSTEFKTQAAKSSVYLLGGGVGRNVTGDVLIGHAETELAQNHIKGITFVRMPEKDLATYSAASMAAQAFNITRINNKLKA